MSPLRARARVLCLSTRRAQKGEQNKRKEANAAVQRCVLGSFLCIQNAANSHQPRPNPTSLPPSPTHRYTLPQPAFNGTGNPAGSQWMPRPPAAQQQPSPQAVRRRTEEQRRHARCVAAAQAGGAGKVTHAPSAGQPPPRYTPWSFLPVHPQPPPPGATRLVPSSRGKHPTCVPSSRSTRRPGPSSRASTRLARPGPSFLPGQAPASCALGRLGPRGPPPPCPITGTAARRARP